jgi:hypothetical protein
MDHIVTEVPEILLHPRNFNRAAGFTLSQTWQLIINIIKQSAQQSIDSLREPKASSSVSLLPSLGSHSIPIPRPDRGIYRTTGHQVVSSTLKMGTESVPQTLENFHILMQVCPRRFYWILSPWKLQDIKVSIINHQTQLCNVKTTSWQLFYSDCRAFIFPQYSKLFYKNSILQALKSTLPTNLILSSYQRIVQRLV